MLRVTALILFFLTGGWAFAQQPRELVGRYRMEVQGGDVLELRADGSATLAGGSTRWSAGAGVLKIGDDALAYRLQGDRLIIAMGGMQLGWKRIGNEAASSPLRPPPRAQQADAVAAGAPDDEQARRVLMASAWCSFSYNQVSGASSTRRAVFRSDGLLAISNGGESYSSGYGGTHAGQSSGAQMMRWQVRHQRLYVDDASGAGYQDVGLTAVRNSSGYLILRAGGREYSQCR